MARLSPDTPRTGAAPDAGMAQYASHMPRALWLLPLVVAVVIAAGALYEYAGPPAASRHVYVVSQALRVSVPVAGAASSYDAYTAHQKEDAVARDVASGGLLQARALDAAIAQEYAAERGRAPEAGSAGARATVSAGDVASALAATHTGNLITLYARWHTPGEAQALLRAAVATLTAEEVPNLPALSPAVSGSGSQTAVSVLIQVDGAASGATLDGAVEAAATQTLLVRLGFAVAAGVVVLLALVVVTRRAKTGEGEAERA